MRVLQDIGLYYIDVSLQDIVGSAGATFLYHQALESAALESAALESVLLCRNHIVPGIK